MIRWAVPIVWLVVVWLALWEEISFLKVVAGVLVAVGLVTAFRPGGGIARWFLRPIAGLRFAVYFTYQFIVANIEVALAVMFPSRVEGRQAIVSIPVSITNPGVLSVLAAAVSFTPGTSVIEVHTNPSVLYLHVLDLKSAEATRDDVHQLEWRLIRAFRGWGSNTDGHLSAEDREAARLEAREGDQ